MACHAVAAGPLDSPAWQGIGAIVAIVALVLYVWFDLMKKRSRDRRTESASIRLFELSDADAEREFYDELTKSVRRATKTIYRSGRGFDRLHKGSVIEDLLQAERFALQKDVEVVRIQTATGTIPIWSDFIAKLLEEHSSNFRIFADFAEPPLVNVAIIDAFTDKPTIQLLFEASEPSAITDHARGACAIFLYGQSLLTVSLANQFLARTQALRVMSPTEVRELGTSCVYFAYGSNMSAAQMKSRVPGAKRLGQAYLYGWRLNFKVHARHLPGGAAAAGIEQSSADSDFVEGVAYALSASDKRRLDSIEYGGYKPTAVGIKLAGKHRDAYAHVPLQLSEIPSLRPSLAYIELMITGARENGLDHLLGELERLRDDLQP